MLLLILIEVKWINSFLVPLQPSENHKFSDDFWGDRSELIHLNLFNIWSEIWRQSLTLYCESIKSFAVVDPTDLTFQKWTKQARVLLRV